MNIESSAAPITTSGVAIGMTISRFAARRPWNLWRTRAIAIRVPIAVEITVESAASRRLVSSASFSSGSVKALRQYSVVKPLSRPKVSFPLGVSPKEKTAMTTIGISM